MPRPLEPAPENARAVRDGSIPRNRRMRWPGVVLLVALIAGCSSDDAGSGRGPGVDSDTEAEVVGRDADYAAALADKVADLMDPVLVPAGRECAGLAILEAFGGADRLEELGISVDDVKASSGVDELGLDTGGEVPQMLGAGLTECDLSLGRLVVTRLGTEASADADGSVQAFVDCIDERLDEQMVGELFLSETDGHLTEATLRCVAHLEIEDHS